MPEWLTQTFTMEESLSRDALLVRLAASLVFGVVVAYIYRISHGREKQDCRAMFTTLVLLSVLIAMVSVVIGNSVARAFSLVGALSIVRFRTVVDDTRDTAFVIFAVIVGMAAGAGLMLVAAIGIPIVGVAAVALSRMGPPTASGAADCSLMIRLALGRDPDLLLADVQSRFLEDCRITGTATAKQGSALELTYAVRLRGDVKMTDFVAQLNLIEGVQAVDSAAVNIGSSAALLTYRH